MASNDAEFERLKWQKFPVLDDGFVALVDRMGDDAAVVQAARVSYGEGTKHINDDRTLIRYLLRHWHTTPFEMIELKFLIRLPMDMMRQHVRHRMSSTNEYSTRYSTAIDAMATTAPDAWRTQATANKQGSSGAVAGWPEGVDFDDYGAPYNGPVTHPYTMSVPAKTPGEYLSKREKQFHEIARAVYEERLGFGIAREQARKDLPLSNYTECYWKIDGHNLLHYLRLRMDEHAQWEIRQLATAIGEQIFKPLYPAIWEAFEDYRLNAMTLTRLDAVALASVHKQRCDQWSGDIVWNRACESVGWPIDGPCRERDECRAKLVRLGILT